MSDPSPQPSTLLNSSPREVMQAVALYFTLLLHGKPSCFRPNTLLGELVLRLYTTPNEHDAKTLLDLIQQTEVVLTAHMAAPSDEQVRAMAVVRAEHEKYKNNCGIFRSLRPEEVALLISEIDRLDAECLRLAMSSRKVDSTSGTPIATRWEKGTFNAVVLDERGALLAGMQSGPDGLFRFWHARKGDIPITYQPLSEEGARAAIVDGLRSWCVVMPAVAGDGT